MEVHRYNVFEVGVAPHSASDRARRFTVTGPAATSGEVTTRRYDVARVDHSAYLDFFDGLAIDFGTRPPANRTPRPPPTFTAPLEPLLTTNIAPRILYGYGDPAVLRVADGEHGSTYYAVVTSNDAADALPILRSRTLADWQLAGFVFPDGCKPGWAADGANASDFWAPEMHRLAGRFHVYFAAREKASGEMAIGLATAPRPDGPFVARPEPLLRGNVIDPNVLVLDGGEAYLYWKEDRNDRWPGLLTSLLHRHPELVDHLFVTAEDQHTAHVLRALWPWARTLDPMHRFFVLQVLIEAVTANWRVFRSRLAQRVDTLGDPDATACAQAALDAMRTPIYGQRLSDDGLRLLHGRHVVLENDQDWEGHLIEGTWACRYHGKFYLFYSANDFSTAAYGIGVACADAALGPYTKMSAPLLRSTAQWLGPGHPSVADGPDGKPRLFMHAFRPGHLGYKQFRALLTVPIAFRPDGVVLRRE